MTGGLVRIDRPSGTGAGRMSTGVAVVTPRAGYERTLVACPGYAAAADAFELQRFALLATQWRARIVVVETPGCSVERSRLRANERWALVTRADFEPLGERILAAAVRAVDGARIEGLVGYSLGASIAVGVALAHRTSSDDELGSVTVVEPVGHRRWTAGALRAAMRAESAEVDGYLAETATVPGMLAPADRRLGAPTPHAFVPDMLVAANALRAGRLALDVCRALAGTRTDVIVVHGAGSRVSPPQANAILVRSCAAARLTVHDVVVSGSHGLWHSLVAVRDLARQVQLAARWAS